MGSYVRAWVLWSDFRGRATRSEYWGFVIVNTLIAIAIMVVESNIETPIFSTIYLVASLVPHWAVTVRRLHDTGKSGWAMAIQLIPFLGGVVLLAFMLEDSQRGSNQYGLQPGTYYTTLDPHHSYERHL